MVAFPLLVHPDHASNRCWTLFGCCSWKNQNGTCPSSRVLQLSSGMQYPSSFLWLCSSQLLDLAGYFASALCSSWCALNDCRWTSFVFHFRCLLTVMELEIDLDFHLSKIPTRILNADLNVHLDHHGLEVHQKAMFHFWTSLIELFHSQHWMKMHWQLVSWPLLPLPSEMMGSIAPPKEFLSVASVSFWLYFPIPLCLLRHQNLGLHI